MEEIHIAIKITSIDRLEHIPDPDTDMELLPGAFQLSDNSLRMRHLKQALREAICLRLTPVQRRYIEMHYWQGLGKSDIARYNGVSCSTVTRTIAVAMESINSYVSLYMRIFDRVSRDIYDTL